MSEIELWTCALRGRMIGKDINIKIYFRFPWYLGGGFQDSASCHVYMNYSVCMWLDFQVCCRNALHIRLWWSHAWKLQNKTGKMQVTKPFSVASFSLSTVTSQTAEFCRRDLTKWVSSSLVASRWTSTSLLLPFFRDGLVSRCCSVTRLFWS